MLVQQETKTCRSCLVSKNISDFAKCATGKHGVRGTCKQCTPKIWKKKEVSCDRPLFFKCTSCCEEKAFDTTNFKKNTSGKYGLTSECRKCLTKRNVIWAKATYAKRKYKMREWRIKNKDKIAEYRKKYTKSHKETIYTVIRNYRARKANALGSHTNKDVNDLLLMQGHKCAICKTKLTKYHVDHIYPLARGGGNEKHNLQILCPSCNTRKWCKDPIDFAKENGFLI